MTKGDESSKDRQESDATSTHDPAKSTEDVRKKDDDTTQLREPSIEGAADDDAKV